MTYRARNDVLTRAIAFLLIASVFILSGFTVAQADPAAISQAQREAQELRNLIDKLDAKLSAADEKYNYAAQQLKETRAAQTKTKAELAKTENDLADARDQLMTRLVEIYKGGQVSMLEVLLDANTYSDFVNRLDQLGRISEQDSRLVARVGDYLTQVKDQQARLAEQARDEKIKVAQLEDAKQNVAAQLDAQEKALQGKQAQIAQLEREEEARQARLAAAARAAAARAAAEAAQEQERATVRVATATQSDSNAGADNNSPARSESTGSTQTSRSTNTTVASPHNSGNSGSQSTSNTSSRSSSRNEGASTGSSSSNTGSSASGARAKVVSLAMNYLGVPYVWGSSNPKGFDCSGLVMYVYAKVGVNLPHSSAMQYNCGRHISKSELRPGDLVFFYNPIHHVGIYIGGGQMINARTGGVRIDSAFWSSYAGACRVLN
ncbi:MAG: NlpC/P60 family protein [Thermoleophilia bacterium]|jgi:cell wall-associated NlpC family hydrolase